MTRYEIRTLLISLLSALIILSCLRLGFYLYFIPSDQPLEFNLLAQSLYIGAKFDLRLLLFIHLPLILLSWVSWFNPTKNSIALNIWRGYFIVIYMAVLASYAMDFGYYAYLEIRLDASILRFAYNLDTSLEMIQQTYPVFWITFGYLTVFVLLLLTMRSLWRLSALSSNTRLLKRLGSSTLILLILVTGLWGKMSWYPLRWSDAFYSTNEFASKLALNPVLYFLDTLKNKDGGYDEEKVKEAYPLMIEYLGIDNPDIENLSFQRNRQSTGFAHRPNVVIVLLESFAWYKTGLSGNPVDPTPHFDKIAKKGISFDRYYAPHGGTARSVWALLTGLPDIEMNKTSSRNPLVVNQHTIINAFKDYERFYFLGGSASWANIRGLLSNNIPGLNIYEEGSYESPRMDVWGISDLHLFEEADKVLQQQNKPFFAIIQTSGNHRPYNIPEDNHGFTLREEDKDKLKKHGFRSVADYNAMRFMDHSIGFFMRQAAQSSYYKDTIFVFLADHGNMRHATHLPPYVEKLGLTEFQSPLVIFKPGAEGSAKTVTTIASQLDVLPTIANFASQQYTNTTLGRDILDDRYNGRQGAFTVTFGRLPNIGLVEKNYYFSMYTDGSKKRLHALHAEKPESNLVDEQPEIAKRMQQTTRALYETASYMRYHNQSKDSQN